MHGQLERPRISAGLQVRSQQEAIGEYTCFAKRRSGELNDVHRAAVRTQLDGAAQSANDDSPEKIADRKKIDDITRMAVADNRKSRSGNNINISALDVIERYGKHRGLVLH